MVRASRPHQSANQPTNQPINRCTRLVGRTLACSFSNGAHGIFTVEGQLVYRSPASIELAGAASLSTTSLVSVAAASLEHKSLLSWTPQMRCFDTGGAVAYIDRAPLLLPTVQLAKRPYVAPAEIELDLDLQ